MSDISNENDPLIKDDALERLYTLLGRVVYSHENLNNILRDAIASLNHMISGLKYKEGGSWDYVDSIDRLAGYKDPINSYLNLLGDKELRDLFFVFLYEWHKVQSGLIANPDWFHDFPEKVVRCIKEENSSRNLLIHSSYSFDQGINPHEEIRSKRRSNSQTPKDNKGRWAKRLVNITSFETLERFTWYQGQLNQWLEDFELSLYVGFSGDRRIATNSSNDFIKQLPLKVYQQRDHASGKYKKHEIILNEILKDVEGLDLVDSLRSKLDIKGGENLQ